MTGLTLGDLSELDIELNIADSRTVTEVFREVVGGGDGSAVLGRGTAASAADAAGSGYEKDNRHALETWVAYHRNEVFEKRLEGRSPLDFLIEKLESLLGN